MTHFNDPVCAATAAAEELAVDLLEEAVSRCRSEELEDCTDWHSVFDLVDDAARRIYGEGVHQCVCRLLTEAGVELPIDPNKHGCSEACVVVEAVVAACDELAEIQRAAMPSSFEEALQLATARVHYDRDRLCPTPYAERRSPANAAVIDDWLEGIPRFPFNLELLVERGITVVREGRPALPSTPEELSEACHAFQDYLISDVRERLSSYCDPIVGRIDVRDVTLTAEQEAAVRALAEQIGPASA